jgi:thiol-disulfide isomerase/thioredoxin
MRLTHPLARGFAAALCLAVALAAGAADQPSIPVGSVPEDRLGKDLNGNQVHVSDEHGKVVIVSFWASWCGPCKRELPVLASVVKKVGTDQLRVFAINYQDQEKPFRYVVDVLKDYPITFLRDADGKAARKYNVKGIPRLIMIGRDGKVAADFTGYGESEIPELIEKLNALLRQQT